MRFLKYIIIFLFLLVSSPISDISNVRAESSEQQKKKRKKKKKKKSSSKKRNPQVKREEKRKKKKTSDEEDSGSSKSSSQTEKVPNSANRVNTAAYADELFNLTGELEASNKELARATRYFYQEEPKKAPVTFDSKPYFTTEDFEKESRMNPDNLYVQRQLGMHYQLNGKFDLAKEVYLTQVAKNPRNPDAFFSWISMRTWVNIKGQKYAFEEALYLDPNHEATIDAMSMFVANPDQKT